MEHMGLKHLGRDIERMTCTRGLCRKLCVTPEGEGCVKKSESV